MIKAKLSGTGERIETYIGARPICNQCGVELRPVYDTDYDFVKITRKATAYEIESGRDIDENGKTGDTKRRDTRRIFTGRFGVDGCDKFCSQKCAYKWAVLHSRRKFKEEE